MHLKNILLMIFLCLPLFCCCGKKDKDRADGTEEQISEFSHSNGKVQPVQGDTVPETGNGYAFPSELIQEMESSFAKGDPILEKTEVARVLATVKKKNSAEQEKKRKLTQQEILDLAAESGFADSEDFMRKSAETFAAYTLISAMAEYQVMIKGYRSGKKTEKAARQIKQTKTILAVRIKSSKLTLTDTETLKQHWETWKELTDI